MLLDSFAWLMSEAGGEGLDDSLCVSLFAPGKLMAKSDFKQDDRLSSGVFSGGVVVPHGSAVLHGCCCSSVGGSSRSSSRSSSATRTLP